MEKTQVLEAVGSATGLLAILYKVAKKFKKKAPPSLDARFADLHQTMNDGFQRVHERLDDMQRTNHENTMQLKLELSTLRTVTVGAMKADLAAAHERLGRLENR